MLRSGVVFCTLGYIIRYSTQFVLYLYVLLACPISYKALTRVTPPPSCPALPWCPDSALLPARAQHRTHRYLVLATVQCVSGSLMIQRPSMYGGKGKKHFYRFHPKWGGWFMECQYFIFYLHLKGWVLAKIYTLSFFLLRKKSTHSGGGGFE